MKIIKKLLIATLLGGVAFLSACSDGNGLQLLNEEDFATEVDGKKVGLYTLQAGNITMQVTNYGGRVVSLWTPDREQRIADVVLGYENIDRYIHNTGERFLGATVGRYANRIADGKFELEGKTYNLSTYNNGQCLHGGDKGFDRVVWQVAEVDERHIVLEYLSPDMEEGFPGNLSVRMTYTLTNNNEFKVDYSATTDRTTVCNLSHHSFFNLHGEGNGSILDHVVVVNADRMTPVNEVLIPTGELRDVTGTPFDFREPHAIGERISQEDEQLKNGNGYDHNWVLNHKEGEALTFAASVYEPTSGRKLEVFTDQPALQFYSGNFFDGTTVGKSGKSLNYRASLALETQKYPDSPNHEAFPSTVLRAGEVYEHHCVYRFSVE